MSGLKCARLAAFCLFYLCILVACGDRPAVSPGGSEADSESPPERAAAPESVATSTPSEPERALDAAIEKARARLDGHYEDQGFGALVVRLEPLNHHVRQRAAVEVGRSGPGRPEEAKTVLVGRPLVLYAPAGEKLLRARTPGGHEIKHTFKLDVDEIEIVDGLAFDPVTFRTSASIEGTVEADVPDPSGIRVSVLPAGPSALTDTEGRFRLEGVGVGIHELEAVKEGFISGSTRIATRTGRTTKTTLEVSQRWIARVRWAYQAEDGEIRSGEATFDPEAHSRFGVDRGFKKSWSSDFSITQKDGELVLGLYRKKGLQHRRPWASDDLEVDEDSMRRGGPGPGRGDDLRPPDQGPPGREVHRGLDRVQGFP